LVAAIATAGFAPVVGHAALRSLETPFDARIVGDLADATAAVLVALLCFASACSVAWWMGARRRPRSAAIVRAVALSSVAGCAALVGYAAITSRIAPSPAAYAEALPMVAWLPSSDATAAGFFEERPLASPVGDGFGLGRTCIARGCFAHVQRGANVRTIGPRLGRGAALSLHHDSRAARVVLVADGRIIATMDAALETIDWTMPSAATVAAQVSLPRSFIGLALAALFGALIAMSWRRRLHSELRSVVGAREVMAEGNGWLFLDDGTPRRTNDLDLDSGPMVLIQPDARGAGYRGERYEAPLSLRRGVRRVLIEQLSIDVETADAIIISWVLALSAPLLVAATIRLLS
jgi:hypothetical protein